MSRVGLDTLKDSPQEPIPPLERVSTSVPKANSSRGGDAKLRGSGGKLTAGSPPEPAELPPRPPGGCARVLANDHSLQGGSNMLRKLSQRINSEEKGFTLIEL